MYLKKSPRPKHDPQVRQLQITLNAIRTNIHGNWPHLTTDGLFGTNTEQAVRGFQCYRNITPVSGEVGDTTMNYINEAYRHVPVIKTAPASTAAAAGLSGESAPGLSKIIDSAVDLIKEMHQLVQGEIKYAMSLGKCAPQTVVSHFKSSMGDLDPKMARLKQLFRNYTENRALIAQSDSLARTPAYTARNIREQMTSRSVDRMRSSYLTQARISANQAASISKKYITGLQKFDITTKVSRLFSQYGITGNIKITRLRTIKIKAGGIFLAYSLKDIVWDLLQFDQWGDEQWQNRLTKHCYEFLDQAIVGAISGVIATVIAGVGFGIAGIAVPAGVMVVIVAVAAILIGLFIGWLIAVCYGEDFSFTKYAFEGSASRIIETVYGIQ